MEEGILKRGRGVSKKGGPTFIGEEGKRRKI